MNKHIKVQATFVICKLCIPKGSTMEHQRNCQGTKDLMLTYRKTDYLVIVKYLDSDYAGCTDTCIMYLLARRSDIIKVCEADYHCCIYYESRVCGML